MPKSARSKAVKLTRELSRESTKIPSAKGTNPTGEFQGASSEGVASKERVQWENSKKSFNARILMGTN